MEDVIVIGAGPAGLASGYYLQQAGIRYKILERSQSVGHTWDNLYPSLRLNTTRWYSHLPETPFPRHYPIFPTAKQYHDHLEGFAEAQDLNIHFGVEVQRVSQTDNGWWRVESSEGVDVVPCVISATGRFGDPIWPEIPGLDEFHGEVLHAHDYLGPEPFAGQRVMVIGNGPSGVDIAPELGNEPDMPTVLLAMRTGVILRPRYPWGLPKHAWMILSDHLPDFIGHPLKKHIASIKFENLDQVGIRVPDPGKESTAAGTRGDELIRAVKAGRVLCVPGPKRFYGPCVELDDGTTHQIDAVILATGYRPILHQYLDADYEVDRDGWPVRDQSQYTPHGRDGEGYPSDSGREVKDLPGLYLVGVFYQGKGALYNCNAEAEIAVKQIQTQLKAINQAEPSLA